MTVTLPLKHRDKQIGLAATQCLQTEQQQIRMQHEKFKQRAEFDADSAAHQHVDAWKLPQRILVAGDFVVFGHEADATHLLHENAMRDA